MRHIRNVEHLSAEGRWEEVFECLGVDQDQTVELTDLKVPNATITAIVHQDLAKVTALEFVLALIWLVDQLLFVALMVYSGLLTLSYLRLLLSALLFKCRRCLKIKAP